MKPCSLLNDSYASMSLSFISENVYGMIENPSSPNSIIGSSLFISSIRYTEALYRSSLSSSVASSPSFSSSLVPRYPAENVIMKLDRKTEATEKMQTKVTRVDFLVLQRYFQTYLIISTRNTGISINAASAIENGRMFDICAKINLKKPLIYLLKKSANGGLKQMITYRMTERSATISDILHHSGTFSYLSFTGVHFSLSSSGSIKYSSEPISSSFCSLECFVSFLLIVFPLCYL